MKRENARWTHGRERKQKKRGKIYQRGTNVTRARAEKEGGEGETKPEKNRERENAENEQQWIKKSTKGLRNARCQSFVALLCTKAHKHAHTHREREIPTPQIPCTLFIYLITFFFFTAVVSVHGNKEKEQHNLLVLLLCVLSTFSKTKKFKTRFIRCAGMRVNV